MEIKAGTKLEVIIAALEAHFGLVHHSKEVSL